MSTIASPRPSMSSRRTSTSTVDTTTTHAPSVDRGSLRRNRAALRDYYNLKTTTGTTEAPSNPSTTSLDIERESELDKPDFDAQSYVTTLLAKEGLDAVLKVEAGLVSEIRSLDGEKKALVYDNYSKLIAATDTIRSMREKMEPLETRTGRLEPAIGHIAETAGSLSRELGRSQGGGTTEVVASGEEKRREQRDTVRWVLAAPQRFQQLVHDGQREAADKEWNEVRALLDKWTGVRGVDDIRHACTRALGDGEGG